MKKVNLWLFAALSISLGMSTSCNNGKKADKKEASAKNYLDLSSIDSTVSPRNDFFEYANGTWLKNVKIPADKTGWGSFYIVRDQALSNMKTILDSCLTVKSPKKGSVTQQVKDFYKSAMDSTKINKLGVKPLQKDIASIDAITNPDEMMDLIIAEYKKGNGLLASFYVAPDDKNSNLERAQLHQGGLGLPNKTYYFKTDTAGQNLIAAYKKYIANILNLSTGDKNAAADAEAIFELEKRLADVSKSPVELRDPKANYHLISVKEMEQKAPNFKWSKMLSAFNVNVDTLLVGQPKFYAAASKLIASTPIDVWKKYLTFHLVSSYASWLSEDFAQAHFNFYSKRLNGQQKPEIRWKRASSLVNSNLGDALGQLYVKKFFPPEAKQYMITLVHNLQKAYAAKIKANDWLSDSTKEKAIEKLNAFTLKIGYPDKWKDYSSVDISPDALVQNLENIGKWQFNYNINKLGKPTDKTEWQMTAPTVNAYYNPSFNEIVFPAGILIPPFYSQGADDAVNYGAIGYVIGHEMTHGFDDQGSQYDKDGNLNNWWTKKDRKHYKTITKKVVDLYSSFTVQDSVHVNGELTLGENMADIGGLAIAHAAFEMTPEAHKDTLIDGLTPEQRFFMSCAQVWRIKTRPKRMLFRIKNDPHSPEMYRVNGPLSNMESFYKAYGVKPGDKMYRPDSTRIVIW